MQKSKKSITFYHGTSTALNIGEQILPSIQTGTLREHWRKKNIDKVFFTTSQLSAMQFANKAVAKYGGEPVVYLVKPVGQYFQLTHGEYIAQRAFVVEALKYKN